MRQREIARGLRRQGLETRYTLDLRLQARVGDAWYTISDTIDYEWFLREHAGVTA